MSNRKSKENKFFLFSYRIHMTPKRPDHKCGEMGTRHIPVWEEKGTSHSCGQQTSNRGHVPGSPGHTWGHIKRGNNSD